MWYSENDPIEEDTPERRAALINEIRHLEKSTNDALRTTQDELERLEASSSQTRSRIDHLERKLKVLEKNQKGHHHHHDGGGVNKKFNSFLNRSATLSGGTGTEQLEELRRSVERRPSVSNNLRNSMLNTTKHNNRRDGFSRPAPPRRSMSFRRSNQSPMTRSTLSRSISVSGHSFALGVSNHSRLSNLLSGLATHDSGDEEESSTSESTSSHQSSSSSSSSSSEESNVSDQANPKSDQQKSQIKELNKTLQLKRDQQYQLQHDKHSNSSKLSILQSLLYNLHKEHRQVVQDHECKMKMLQEIYDKKWSDEYVEMRSNSITRAEERLAKWKSRVEKLETEVSNSDDQKKRGRNERALKKIQDDITMYQVQMKLHGMYKQKILDSLVSSLEKMRANDGKQIREQVQCDIGSNVESNCSQISECPTGGEADKIEEEEVEDISYIIGEDEGLTPIQSVEGSDISETASEDVEESIVSSTNKTPPETARRHLTVLITSGNFNLTQTANQRSTLQLLKDQSLPYVTIDGMDPDNLERRNELFSISGIRGNYPQIFVSIEKLVGSDGAGGDNDVAECNDEYLGGLEWLECCDLEQLKEKLSSHVENGDNNMSTEETVGMEQHPIQNEIAAEMESHLQSLEEAVKIMEGRVKDFEILSAPEVNHQLLGKKSGSMNAANRLTSLTSECADVLENYANKTSDIVSSLLQLQRWISSPHDDGETADTCIKDKESTVISDREKEMVAEIEQKKEYMEQLEKSLDDCNTEIEQLKNEFESLQVTMDEQNQTNEALLAEIQTKMKILTKRLEYGSNEIRTLTKELNELTHREDKLLRADHARSSSLR